MPPTIDYNALARTVQQGYDEDDRIDPVSFLTPLELQAREAGLYPLQVINILRNPREIATAQRDALLNATLGFHPNYTFYIPRDFLIDLLYTRPTVHGIHFVLGSQKVRHQIPGSLNPSNGRLRSIDVYKHQLFIIAASFTSGVHRTDYQPELHHLIRPYYYAEAGTTVWTPQPDSFIKPRLAWFNEYQMTVLPPYAERPLSYFVGRRLLIQTLLNVKARKGRRVSAGTIQQGYSYLRVELLLEGHDASEPEKQRVGLAMRGVQNTQTGLFSRQLVASAGPVFCTPDFSIVHSGQHCTLPCPTFCPQEVE